MNCVHLIARTAVNRNTMDAAGREGGEFNYFSLEL